MRVGWTREKLWGSLYHEVYPRGRYTGERERGVGMVIREMVEADAAEVAGLCGQLGYERSGEQVRGWLARVGAGAGRAAFVACVDGAVAGWVEVSMVEHVQSDPHGLIGGLVVRDGARGLGIGRHLCERAEAWAGEQGAGEMVVTSRSTRREAHRFYLRDGYRRVKTSEVFAKESLGRTKAEL